MKANLLLTLCLCISAGLGQAAEEVHFYVAPSGADENSGTEAAPFASPHRAAEAACAASGKAVTVHLAPGQYPFRRPLRIEHSQAASILFQGAPDAEVLFSGARKITGWEALGEDRWRAKAPEAGAWRFRQLYAGDKRLPRGRFPDDEGLLHISEVNKAVTEITLDTPLPCALEAAEAAELVVIQNWSISRGLITESQGAVLKMKNPVGWIGHAWTTASAGKPAFLENAAAFVNKPGEWYLDTARGEVTYCAGPGEDPNTRDFYAPCCQQLIDLRGAADKPLTAIHFKHITFADCGWQLPDFGYAGIQAGHYGPDFKQATYVLPAAIRFHRTENCALEDCHILRTGAGGIALGAGCRENRILNCTLDDIGGNGILVGWRGDLETGCIGKQGDASLAADWARREDRPLNNRIEDCRIQRCGQVQFGAVGIYDAYCEGTKILHNEVKEMPYTGVSIGFRWDTSETTQCKTLVEGNHIFDVMKKLADGGAIYTLGYQPGTLLRANALHDVHRSAYAHGGAPNNGIFFDQGSKALHIEKNAIYSTSGEPIRFNQCDKSMLSWGENAFVKSLGDSTLAQEILEQAGPRSPR